jgi:hypothetical protein
VDADRCHPEQPSSQDGELGDVTDSEHDRGYRGKPLRVHEEGDPAIVTDGVAPKTLRVRDDRSLARRVGKGEQRLILEHFSLEAVTTNT